ncbi:MAG: ABC transporter substrate-binding protein [Phycisphaerales bacterium]
MQNRFGLKDFVLLVLVLATGGSVWLAMVQEDRRWTEVHAMNERLKQQEGAIVRLERTLERGGEPAAQPPPLTTAPPGGRDESWARPGVPVDWQPPWGFVNDPRDKPGYRPGGEFTEVFTVQPAKLTPYISTDVYARRIIDLTVDTLGAYDPATLKLRGWLAEAWQYAPDGSWLRVRIRPEARFSDGLAVTAEDVRYTWHDFVMNPEIEAERARSIYQDIIDRVTVIDARTVEFAFKGAFFSNLDSALTLFILPRHFYSGFSAAEINQSTGLLMGSGAYKLETLDKDRQWAPPGPVVIVRNEQYWGPRPPIDRLRFKAIDNELARLTEYKTGQADMVEPSAPQFVAQQQDPAWIAGNHNLNWVNMRSGRTALIWQCGPRGGPDGRLTPFRDPRVRLAMTHLLDRERMIRDIWKGVGQVAVGFFNPGTMGSDPGVMPWPHDLTRARELLREAGWEDRNGDRVLEDAQGNEFRFELTFFTAGEIGERISKFVVDACAAAGIRCTIRQMDWSVGEPVRQQRDFDAMMMGWGANAPESDPKQIFHSESIKNLGDNFGQWNNPEADRFIDAARKELDAERRERLWREVARVMHEDQPYTWVRVQPFVRFVKPDVGNITPYARGLELWEFFRGGAATPGPGT